MIVEHSLFILTYIISLQTERDQYEEPVGDDGSAEAADRMGEDGLGGQFAVAH